MLQWWIHVVLPLTFGLALLALCCLTVWLRLREIFPRFSLAGFIMSILDNVTDVPNLKLRLAEISNKPSADKGIDKKQLNDSINEKIYGQTHIVEEIVNGIFRESLREKRRTPVGRYMIAGPSGTGKSQLGKVLGEHLFGRNGWVLFPMGTASNDAKANAIFGVPMGYQGGDRSAPSIAHLLTYPASVVIVDEFEKTTKEVQHRFLEALEDGVLTNVSTGGKVDVTKAIFIFTTNAKQDQCGKAGANKSANIDEISQECKRILADDFDSAIMSRIDFVFAFQPLEEFALCELIGSKIIELVESYPMQMATIDLEILVQWMQRYDGRNIDGRDVTKDVIRTISEQLNDLKLKGVKRVAIADKKGKLTVVPN